LRLVRHTEEGGRGLTGENNSTVKTAIESCSEKILLEIAVRVTTALLLRCNALIPTVVDINNIKS
jgi:hypothetical protein